MDTPLEKYLVTVASPDVNLSMREFSRPMDDDPRFRLVSVPNTLSALTDALKQGEPDLLIVYADIASKPEELMKLLGNLKRAVAFVILPLSWAATQGAFENVGAVKKVILPPVVSHEVLNAAAVAIHTAQTMDASIAPLQAAYGDGRSAAAMGTRVVSFVSAEGGVGRTTVSEALAFELGVRRSVQTLYCSFDWPAKVPLHLKMNIAPNADEFFSRPGRSGFQESLQLHKSSDALQVLLAPQDLGSYDNAEKRSVREGPSAQDTAASIRALVTTAYTLMYAAVILDLPAGYNAWTWHPLAVSNTVVIVARPTMDSMKAVGTMADILTKMLAAEHQFSRDSIFVLLNLRQARSSFTAATFKKAVEEHYHWCPVVLTTIDHDPNVPVAQDSQRPASELSEALNKGAISLANAFWPMTADARPARPVRRFGIFRVVEDTAG